MSKLSSEKEKTFLNLLSSMDAEEKKEIFNLFMLETKDDLKGEIKKLMKTEIHRPSLQALKDLISMSSSMNAYILLKNELSGQLPLEEIGYVIYRQNQKKICPFHSVEKGYDPKYCPCCKVPTFDVNSPEPYKLILPACEKILSRMFGTEQ